MLKLCSMDDFEKEIGTSRIAAIGAGKRLSNILKKHNCNVIYAVDSDPQKAGEIFRESNIDVKGWDYLFDHIDETYVLLITPAEYRELYEKIENDNRLKNKPCYIYTLMSLLQADVDRQKIEHKEIVFKQREKELIPKKIHYFWFSKDPYPQKIQRCIDSWKRLCPDYEIIKWDMDNYDWQGNRFVREAIEARKWAFASDYARADVVYRYGGIYLDADVELLRRPDDLLFHEAFIGFESSEYVDPGSGFGAAPRNPVIRDFCDIYKDKSFILEDGSYNMVVCPVYYTEILKRQGLKTDGSFQLLEHIAVYPYYSFCPHSYWTDRIDLRPDTYSIHHHEGSWAHPEDKDRMSYSIELIRRFDNKAANDKDRDS